jgi:hypothetical protein
MTSEFIHGRIVWHHVSGSPAALFLYGWRVVLRPDGHTWSALRFPREDVRSLIRANTLEELERKIRQREGVA